MKRRGYTSSFLTEINDPDHQKLLNIDKICHILKHVHDTQAKIVIMPDFDCDGISAGTVGLSGLGQLGFNVGLYVPHPEFGYGINIADIQRVQQQFPDVKYIISCDVGITCYDAFEYAKKQNIHVLITDHHEEQKIKPKPLYCDVIVNPCQLAEAYKLRDICGAHVFWQIVDEYAHLYSPENIQLINTLRVFAGIGTIGDMEPVINENRALITDMVQLLKYIYKTPLDDIKQSINASETFKRSFIGLKVLLDELKMDGKIRSEKNVDEKFVAWTIVPMYNSIKRMGLSMFTVFGLFFNSTDILQKQCAVALIKANNDRKTFVGNVFQELHVQTQQGSQPFAPFIYLTKAPGGILGLLANKLDEETGLPTFVINIDTLTGSGRSFPYFPVISTLSGTEFHVAGHEEAFGISFDDLNQVERFYNYLVKHILPLAEEYNKQAATRKTYDVMLGQQNTYNQVDKHINLLEDKAFYNDITSLKPFGVKFNEPKVAVSYLTDYVTIQRMGKEKQHLKIVTPEGLEMIAWNKGNKATNLQDGSLLIFNGQLGSNSFRGQDKLQLIGDVDVIE